MGGVTYQATARMADFHLPRQPFSRGRHQLHQSSGAGAADCGRVKSAFLVNDRMYQGRICGNIKRYRKGGIAGSGQDDAIAYCLFCHANGKGRFGRLQS